MSASEFNVTMIACQWIGSAGISVELAPTVKSHFDFMNLLAAEGFKADRLAHQLW